MCNYKKYYTYILQCKDGSLYTGYTNNVFLRLRKHNEGKGAKYTRGRRPVELLYYEAFDSKSEAMVQEAWIKKKKREEKLAYIRQRQEEEKYVDSVKL